MSVWCIVFTVKALTPSPTLSHSLSRLTYVPSLLWHRHFTHSRLALLRLQFDPYGGSDHFRFTFDIHSMSSVAVFTSSCWAADRMVVSDVVCSMSPLIFKFFHISYWV
ncbi:hypothetical protein T05_12160 [Trichinella murrelli]|uniref:Uncharacterized protein n=1 Tax=Trichinella murrelli TaxID=144512 RepID=A0A0V0U1H9_9BILA|nr:hypothetical protein T05_12160 [Trichinella murrelli]